MGIKFDIVGALFSLGLLAAVWIMQKWHTSFLDPHFLFPTFQNIPESTKRARLANIPTPLFLAAFAFFSLAYIDFHTMMKSNLTFDENNAVPRKGVAIYFLLDQSGSMREEIPVPYSIDPKRELPKIDLMKRVTARFITGDKIDGDSGLQGDLIGVVSFARGARVLAPLTLDHKTVLEDIAAIQPMNSAETDGTAIGYAIYKTASMIAATRHFAQEIQASGKAPYEIKGSAIVVVTDGLQAPSPLDKGKRLRNIDIPEAAEYAKEQHVRLYIINIDPRITMDEFSPHRHIMERATELTGGKFIAISGDTPLSLVYEDIAKLEKSSISNMQNNSGNIDGVKRSFSWYPWLIALGLVSLGVGVFFETITFRRVP